MSGYGFLYNAVDTPTMCYSRTKVISMALHKTTLYINGTWVTSRLKRAHPSLILTWRDKWLGSHLIPQPALQTETTADTSNGGFQTSNVCQDHWHSSHTDWYIQLGGHQTEKDMGDLDRSGRPLLRCTLSLSAHTAINASYVMFHCAPHMCSTTLSFFQL